MPRRFRITLPALLLLCSLPALAQSQRIFGSGKPLVLRQGDLDRRFLRTRLVKMLAQGTREPGCVQLMGGLFTALGEAAPLLHNIDETPPLPPGLGPVLQQQLGANGFGAWAYLQLMIRNIRMEGRMPAAWVNQAAAINGVVQTIDMAKIRMLADGVRPLDNAYFDIAQLRAHFEAEVQHANSFGASTALAEFKDAYLDHEVVFGGLTLDDLSLPEESGARGAPGAIVTATWMSPDNAPLMPSLEPMRGRTTVKVRARLSIKQYVDLARIPKGQRVMIRGRFWGLNNSATELELRDALLFDDRDWTRGAVLAEPAMVATCSAAINDLFGIAAPQPWTGMH